ncbi:MAG: hypothetical protein HYY60_01570 [Parcubacteria group bacterium]|nr:hypothetical protein [Parcubacteria group bacterium]
MSSVFITHKINTPEKQAFWALAFLFLSLFFLYGYFVQITIHTIIDRAGILQDTRNLNVKLGELESEYNAARTALTYEYARSLGFRELEKKDFAKRALVAQNTVNTF